MSNEIVHYGIKGMRWGVRRYQKEDGSLTDSGRSRYSEHSQSKTAIKNAVIIGASALTATLALYGGYKARDWVRDQNISARMHQAQGLYRDINARYEKKNINFSDYVEQMRRLDFEVENTANLDSLLTAVKNVASYRRTR